MSTSDAKFIFLLLLPLLAGVAAHDASEGLQSCSSRGMFVLGDSYVDTDSPPGFVTPPYGISNPGHPNGRLSNGLILTDFAAKYLKLGGLPLHFSKLTPNLPVPYYGVNFASSGSGLSGLALANPANNISVQVSRFESLVASGRIQKEDVADAVFLINTGGNDIRGAVASGLYQNTSASFPADLQMSILERIKTAVKRLRDAGATKFIIGGTKYTVPEGGVIVQGLRELVEKMNRKRKLRAVVLDYGTIYETAISKSQSCYGFNEVVKPCCTGLTPREFCGSLDANGVPTSTVCADPDKSFWWDLVHPTMAGYAQASALAFLGSNFTYPGPNVCDVLQVQCEGSPPPSCPST